MNSRLAHAEYGATGAGAVVLLHSIATSSAMWGMQIPLWSVGQRVIAVDLPGHGASPVLEGEPSLASMGDAVIAVLDSLNIERAAFVGLSLGGMVCQSIALRHADRVGALVLANTTGYTSAEVKAVWQQRIADVQASGMESQLSATLSRWFTPDFRARAPRTTAFIARLILATPAAGFIAAGRAIQQLNYLDALSAVRSPTMVLSGSEDPSIPPSAGAALASRISGARHQLINTAHMSAVEKPIEFAELVGQFLADAI